MGTTLGAGSTGISLAMVAAAAGCRCAVALPDDAAAEKGALLEALGARVLRQRPVSISHPQHFVNVARRLAVEAGACSPANPGPSSPKVSIAHAQHPVNVARRLAAEAGARSSANPGRGGPENPGPESSSPAEPGPGGPEPWGPAAAGGIGRLAGTEANETAALERSGGGSASAGGEGSSGPGSERRAQPGWAAGPKAAPVSQDSTGPASAASLDSPRVGEGIGNGGGGGGENGGGGGESNGGGGGGGGAVFADQFENLANYRAHLATGAEIWAQVLRCSTCVIIACVPSCRVHCILHLSASRTRLSGVHLRVLVPGVHQMQARVCCIGLKCAVCCDVKYIYSRVWRGRNVVLPVRQTGGRLHAFVSGAGTGGTIAGVSRYLKSRDPRIRVRRSCTPLSAITGKLSGLLLSRVAASWDPGTAFEFAEPTDCV